MSTEFHPATGPGTQLSAVEKAKLASNYLRGRLAEELANQEDSFSNEASLILTGLLQNAASLVVYPLGSGIEARKYENYASTGSAFPGKLYLTCPP